MKLISFLSGGRGLTGLGRNWTGLRVPFLLTVLLGLSGQAAATTPAASEAIQIVAPDRLLLPSVVGQRHQLQYSRDGLTWESAGPSYVGDGVPREVAWPAVGSPLLVRLSTYPEEIAQACRIVDYGADVGSGYYRGESTTASGHGQNVALDVDGDGQNSDDSVNYYRFSLDTPFNPPGIEYDTEATSAIFYGGMTAYFSNKKGVSFSEGMVNENHSLRDDFNMMIAISNTVGVQNRCTGLWVWLKRDFLNGGDRYRVSFDSQSAIVPHISRYWDGVNDGRWVVREGEDWWISEQTFTPGTQISQILHPLGTRWAPYHPKPDYQIDFDASGAVFEERTFEDVTGVGFSIAKAALNDSLVALKWHSFEVYANVHRPARPSFHAEMVTIPEGEDAAGPIPAFHLGKTEVPYLLWHRVWKWAVSNQYCFALDPGYCFDEDGDMGSMRLGDGPHAAAEPATAFTWLDAVAWCNALSEMEGERPAYYADAAFTKVLREIKERNNAARFGVEPAVYLDPSSTGYRLPTAREWSRAALAGEASLDFAPGQAWTSANAGGTTRPVGQLEPNALGLCDAAGNVWEMIWDAPAAVYDPALQDRHTVLGGSFRWPADPAAQSLLPWGERPYDGSPETGLRLARGTGGAPAWGAVPEGLPRWEQERGGQVPGAADPPGPPAVSMAYLAGSDPDGMHRFVRQTDEAQVEVSPFFLATTEISYRQWTAVRQWGTMHGYSFDFDGDMGSMDYRTADFAHGPDEPVVEVGWHDVVLFCNALSEWEGRVPVYYEDADRTQVNRTAWPWRIAMFSDPGVGTTEMKWRTIYARWHTDGYRLPTATEWQIAYADAKAADGWLQTNAGGRTQPVGQKAANRWGLRDLAGNVTEWVWDWPLDNYYEAVNPKGTDAPSLLFGKALKGGNFGTGTRAATANDQELPSVGRTYYGFRVARCEAGVHPVDTQPVVRVVLDIEAEDYDSLDGQIFRGNLRRTGQFDGSPVLGPIPEVAWTFPTGGPVHSSPVEVGGTVYVGSDDTYFYALSASNGQQRWRTKLNGAVLSSPCVAGGVVYVGGGNYLYALDAATGAEIWKFTRSSGVVTASPALAYGVVFAGFGKYTGSSWSGISAATGKEVWRYRFGYPNDGPMGPTIDGLVFVAPTSDNLMAAADLRTELPLADWQQSSNHCQGCVAIENQICYFAPSRSVIARSLSTGKNVWSYSIPGMANDVRPQSSPALTGTLVMVGKPDGKLYALRKADGGVAWSFSTGGVINSSPGVAGDYVYFGSADGSLYCLRASTGVKVWSYAAGGAVHSSPWLSGGKVYFGSDDGLIQALR